jgi:hypothetical protein
MKTETLKTASTAIAAGLVLALVVGCAGPGKTPEIVIEKDVSRVIKLEDGTTCVEPAGLAQTRQTPGAVKLKELFDSEEPVDEVRTKAKELKPTADEVEAVYFDACRAYSNRAIPALAFDRDKALYIDLHRQLFAQGVKQWQDKKNGIADAGKLCLISLPDTDPEHRSFTRVVPADSSVYDCAQLALVNGSVEILLGCTKGHWDDTWAKRPISVGAKSRNLSVKGTAYSPDPDCGWN